MDFFKYNWSNINFNNNISTRLSRYKGALLSWAGHRFDQLGKKIYELRNQLDWIMRSPWIKNNFLRIKEIQCRIEKLSDQEEINWKQRSRATWGIGILDFSIIHHLSVGKLILLGAL